MEVPDWGWNPSAVQVYVSGIVGVLTALALAAAAYAALQSKNAANAARSTADIASRESSLRTRPWLGLIGVEYLPDTPVSGNDVLRINFRNVGALPAEDVRLSVDYGPDGAHPIGGKQLIDKPIGAAFPQEPGGEVIEGVELNAWRTSNTTMVFNGNFIYILGGQKFATQFAGQISFKDGVLERASWRNTILHSPDI